MKVMGEFLSPILLTTSACSSGKSHCTRRRASRRRCSAFRRRCIGGPRSRRLPDASEHGDSSTCHPPTWPYPQRMGRPVDSPSRSPPALIVMANSQAHRSQSSEVFSFHPLFVDHHLDHRNSVSQSESCPSTPAPRWNGKVITPK